MQSRSDPCPKGGQPIQPMDSHGPYVHGEPKRRGERSREGVTPSPEASEIAERENDEKNNACLTGLLLGNLIVVPASASRQTTGGDAAIVNDANALKDWSGNRPDGNGHRLRRGADGAKSRQPHAPGRMPPSEANKVDKKRLLADYWDIHSRKEFLETLKWMEEGGTARTSRR